jgi:hypothetical protein
MLFCLGALPAAVWSVLGCRYPCVLAHLTRPMFVEGRLVSCSHSLCWMVYASHYMMRSQFAHRTLAAHIIKHMVIMLVLLCCACRPFPIMMGSIMLPDTPLGFYAIEFSPLYIGSPAFFNDTTPPIGGGFVDPVGEAAQTPCFAAFEGSILCYFVVTLYCIDVLHQVPARVFVDPINGFSVGHQSNMLRCLYMLHMCCTVMHIQ